MLTGAAAVVLAATGAAAEPGADRRWTHLGADHEGEYAYDPGSVERLGGMIRARVRATVPPEQAGQMRSAIVLLEINCVEQTTRYLAFDALRADGTVLNSYASGDLRSGVDPIVHGSPEETLYRRLCPSTLVRPIPPPPRMFTVPPAPMAPMPMPPPPAPPPPPSQDPLLKAVGAQLRIPIASLVTGDDYPPAALRMEEQGTVRVSLDVGPDGRVGGCTVTASSGSSILDAATCRILVARARFFPARGARGRAVADRYATSITWSLPAEPEPPLPAFDPPAPPPPAQPEQS